jgi:crotonobetainyl-CoA:carnitine CoA-transferase CaiB-like acyl-CoA transferase
VHARTGQQWENTSFRHGPVFLHSPVASFGAMFLVPIGIMSALVARDRTGGASASRCRSCKVCCRLPPSSGIGPNRGSSYWRRPIPPVCTRQPFTNVPTASGSTRPPCRGCPKPAPRGRSSAWRKCRGDSVVAMSPEERAEYESRRREAFKLWDRSKLIEELHAAGLGCEAIVAPTRALRSSTAEGDRVGGGGRRPRGRCDHASRRHHLSRLDARDGERAQPTAGAHTDEVLRSLGHDDDEVASLRARGVV